jgi:PII-like signaling protein
MTSKLQLNIYTKQTDMKGDVPLYEAITRWLLHKDVVGATVLRGVMGYGRHRHVHRKGLLGVSDDHPMVVVVVDDADKIQLLLPDLRHYAPGTLMTTQAVVIP